MRDEGARELRGCFERGEVAGELMAVVDGAERLVHDPGALVAVGRLDRANCDRHLVIRRGRFGRVSHGFSSERRRGE
jgi:hypothetical protein